jgi:hypothetical protein
MPAFRTIAVVFVLVLSGLGAAESLAADISRQQLQRMFDQMQKEAHWDLTKPMLWGYYFFNPVFGGPRRGLMIGINQLRFLATQPRVAQPHRYA